MCAREEGPHTSSTMTMMMMWEGGRVCEGQRGSKRMSATSQQPRSPSIAACLLAFDPHQIEMFVLLSFLFFFLLMMMMMVFDS